jgi:hypothetical protein
MSKGLWVQELLAAFVCKAPAMRWVGRRPGQWLRLDRVHVRPPLTGDHAGASDERAVKALPGVPGCDLCELVRARPGGHSLFWGWLGKSLGRRPLEGGPTAVATPGAVHSLLLFSARQTAANRGHAPVHGAGTIALQDRLAGQPILEMLLEH